MLGDAGGCWEMLADSGLRCSARMSGVAWRHFETLRHTKMLRDVRKCSEMLRDAERCLKMLG